jgi:hypothetical protein
MTLGQVLIVIVVATGIGYLVNLYGRHRDRDR